MTAVMYVLAVQISHQKHKCSRNSIEHMQRALDYLHIPQDYCEATCICSSACVLRRCGDIMASRDISPKGLKHLFATRLACGSLRFQTEPTQVVAIRRDNKG